MGEQGTTTFQQRRRRGLRASLLKAESKEGDEKNETNNNR